ncbi:hypothetical protein BU16DRAFT_41058 [Lophium mytilinum]|uniref:Uncharacterized protein n=1 Tax=Lophium mytilinum TaxID=390894 RepID=A0A6A6QRW0_9PEZI|nr:hypothetical protein BU16DRAFT_41058 [Lophium mytilinum]
MASVLYRLRGVFWHCNTKCAKLLAFYSIALLWAFTPTVQLAGCGTCGVARVMRVVQAWSIGSPGSCFRPRFSV